MDKDDLQLITLLIEKYGITKLERILEINKEFLYYMYISNQLLGNKINSLCNESENCQMFTNGTTSVFYLNEKVIDFDILKSRNSRIDTPVQFVDSNEIEKYFNRSVELFGSAREQIDLKNESGTVLDPKSINQQTYSLNEYKLLKLLLGDPKIYASSSNPVICAESEKGYAYVLGKKSGIQSIF